MATIFLYAFIVFCVPQSALNEDEVKLVRGKLLFLVILSLPHACVVTARNQIVTVGVKVETPHCLHVTIERRVAVAVVQIPFLNDAILVGRVNIIIRVGESNVFDTGVMAIEALKSEERKKLRKMRPSQIICWISWRNAQHFPRSLNS